MEQIDKFPYIREDRRYEDFSGTTAEGKPIIWMDSLDIPETISKGQLVRDSPKFIIVEFMHDSQGRAILHNIHTTMKRYLIANNGQVLADTAFPLKMDANDQDEKDFSGMFWQQIRRFIHNGRIRKFLGFNRLPLFGIMGEIKKYTPEQEQEAPTHDYETHRVDGTPLSTTADNATA